MREEKREGEGGAVAGTEGVLEARPIPRRLAVAKVNGRVVDDELVARCGDAARVGVLGLGDGEAGIERGQIVVDAPLVGLHHGLCVRVELLPDRLLAGLDGVLLAGELRIGGAEVGHVRAVSGLDRIQAGQFGLGGLEVAGVRGGLLVGDDGVGRTDHGICRLDGGGRAVIGGARGGESRIRRDRFERHCRFAVEKPDRRDGKCADRRDGLCRQGEGRGLDRAIFLPELDAAVVLLRDGAKAGQGSIAHVPRDGRFHGDDFSGHRPITLAEHGPERGDQRKAPNILPAEGAGIFGMAEAVRNPIAVAGRHAMCSQVRRQSLLGILRNVVDGAGQQAGEIIRQGRNGKFREGRASAQRPGLPQRVHAARLRLDLRGNVVYLRQGNEGVQLHARRHMRLNRLARRADLASFGATLGGQLGILRRELHAGVAHNDTIEIALVLYVHDFAGMDILRDKHAVEDGDVRHGHVPCRTVEAGLPAAVQ